MKLGDFNKLRLQIIFSTLIFSLVPLFVLGFGIKQQFNTSYRDKITDNLRILTESKKKSLDLFLSERISQLTTLAYTESLNDLSDDQYLERIFMFIQSRAKYFIDFGIIDVEGNHIAYSGPYQLKGVNYKNEEWFSKVLAKGYYVSDVFMGFRKYPHFIIAVARREGAKTWILRATIDSDIFDSLVKSVQMGKRGDAYILNPKNVLQTSPRFGPGVLSEVNLPHYSRFAGVKLEEMALDGKTGLFGLSWLENTDWLLVIKEDPAEELKPLFHAEQLLGFILAGGILVICIGAIFVTNKMIGRLIRSEREKALLDASLMQSSKMAALGKLAAGVAHEINNPLAIIKEKAGWLRDLLTEEDVQGSPNFKEFEESIGKIEYHVERAKNVTHRMLGFARKMEPVEEVVEINHVLDQTLTFLKTEALHRSIELITDFDPELPKVRSDSSQLQQVFLNILDNAIDATGKNGAITVSTGRLEHENSILIVIRDTGCGIPPEKLEHIFDPFFTTKKPGEGTGLGLSISFNIIEKLGGKIAVESKVGKGTAFSIMLPVRG